MSKPLKTASKKHRTGCACFSSSSAKDETEEMPNLVMVKNSPQGVADDKYSENGSFFTMNDDDIGDWIPGARYDPDISFRMGETIPHSSSLKTESETSWSNANHAVFNVRTGPDYPKQGLKAPSMSDLYEPFGLDILRGDSVLSNVAPHLLFPPLPEFYDPACGLPAVLVVNSQLPLAMPSLFSSSESDPGWSIVGYFKIRKETVEWAMKKNDPPPAISVLIRLLQKGYSERSLSFKAIGMIHDLEKQDLPLMNLLTKYNGKPVLVTKSAQFIFGSIPYPYLEIDYNVRQWSLIARSTLVQLSSKLQSLTCHVGYLVEATLNEDLPERMLSILTVHNVSIDSAKHVHFDRIGAKSSQDSTI